MTFTYPSRIGDTPVVKTGKPMKAKGEIWVTLIPEDESDERIWEYSITTGRVLQMANPPSSS